MKTADVKQILEHYREGDESTPEIAQALASLNSHPDLATWYKAKTRFDSQMTEAVAQVPVPKELRAAILKTPPVLQLPSWWRRPIALAAAAAVLLFAGGISIWSAHRGENFAQYKKSVIDESWGRAPHLDIETSDVAEFNKWLASIDPHATVTVPSGLNDLNLRGGRTLEWRGHRVVLLCFSQGAKHMHLFVTTDRTFAGLPPQAAPDYEKCNGWKTVSWAQGNRTYVLTGMNYLTFLKKFRHSGHWTMDG